MNFLRGFLHSDSQNSYPSITCGQKRTTLSDATQFYRRFFPILVCCMLLGAPSLSFGQSTFGSVRGVVQDASGAVVSDTEIVLHSTDENTERTVNADASGNFILENVKAGKYSLHAHHNGFADTVISGISVEARQDMPNSNPMKRFGQPEDIANAVCYLAGEMGNFVTGEVMVVDGGNQVWGDQWAIARPDWFR